MLYVTFVQATLSQWITLLCYVTRFGNFRLALLEWWSVSWASPGSMGQLLDWWFDWHFRKIRKAIWNLISAVIVWSLWKVRNDMKFKGAVVIPRIFMIIYD
ncbi:hypothetical protein Dimus_003736 [Dionaea muscipula]